MRKSKEVTAPSGTEYKVNEVPPIEALEHKLIELGAKNFRINKMSVMNTRRVAFQYPTTMMPKIGCYAENEDLFRLLMSYVEVNVGGQWVPLKNDDLINQHVRPEDWLTLEMEVVDLTTGFFSNGSAMNIATTISQFLIARVIKTFTALSESLYPDK